MKNQAIPTGMITLTFQTTHDETIVNSQVETKANGAMLVYVIAFLETSSREQLIEQFLKHTDEKDSEATKAILENAIEKMKYAQLNGKKSISI